MWNHPALRSLIVQWSMDLFGSGVVGVKGFSVLTGILAIPLAWAVGRRLLRSDFLGLVAAFLLAVDTLPIDFSRQAINDGYLTFFPLLAIWCAFRYHEEGEEAVRWLVAAGCAFGFGLASKWSVAVPLALTVAGLGWLAVRVAAPLSARLARLLTLAGLLVILPLTIYLATFAPWFQRGYGISDWLLLQKSMYVETRLHTGYKETIQGQHRAWEWFIRPVYFRDIYFVPPPETERGRSEPSLEQNVVILLAIANPLVWLLTIPATVYTAIQAWRRCDRRLWYLLGCFLLSYLPLAMTWRPIWFNTGLTVAPFVMFLVAFAVVDPWPNDLLRRRAAAVYLGLVAAVALILYPLVIGKGFSVPVLDGFLRAWYRNGL
jgi:dolichyl-phosphate-mannose--protein O-mannosyl transferase